jgi:hypothetical protein
VFAGVARAVPCAVPAVAGVAVAGLVLAAAAARAGEAPADSALHSYVRQLSDSTDAWFGITAAPLDTAGLDSALASGLALPPGARRAGRTRAVQLGWSPAPGFNRADGGQLGLGLSLTSSRLPGRLHGRAQYTTGTKDVIGEGGWSDSWRVGLRSRLSLDLAAGRWTEPFNRDSFDPIFATMGALLWGGDRHHYLRRDGFRASVGLGGESHWARAAWRDQAETSLPYTTRWTVFGSLPDPRANDPAAEGRTRELAFTGQVTIPGTRFHARATHWTSDPRMGSDFTYRRTAVNVAGDVSLGRHLALVPRASYGRLRGEVLPQQAFYFGGNPDIRTLDAYSLSGSGRTYVRSDLILVDDLRTLLRLPLPAWLPLQAGVFAGSGASWGRDPLTNDAIATRRDFPRRSEWMSEAGVSLAWRPGIPDPLSAVRFEYALPIGADERGAAFVVSWTHPLGMLRQR